MKIFDFLVLYWVDFFVVVLFLGLMLWLWKKGERERVKLIIHWFVAKAQKELGGETGQYKKGYVLDLFYTRLPAIIRIIFTKKEIGNFIDLAAAEVDEFLTSGKTLNDDLYFDEIEIYE